MNKLNQLVSSVAIILTLFVISVFSRDKADDGISATAIQKDGKIIAVGNNFNGTDDDFAVVRYNSNGSLDSTFGKDGKVTTSIGANDDYAGSVAIQSDGKIVVSGISRNENENESDFGVIVRYNSNGSLDSSFGKNGQILMSSEIIWKEYFLIQMALQQDGKIVAVSSSPNAKKDGRDIVVFRYTNNGTPDVSFGKNGKITTAIHKVSYANSIEIQPDGKIVIFGSSIGTNDSTSLVIRYNPNGSLDTSLNRVGKLILDDGKTLNRLFPNEIAFQSDGKIVVAGTVNLSRGTPRIRSRIVRYNINGSLDSSFGTKGDITLEAGEFGKDAIYFRSIKIQTDGKIVLFGRADDRQNYYVFRYGNNGNPDETFGKNKIFGNLGYIRPEFGGENYYFSSITIQPDGKIIAAGGSSNGKNLVFAIVRYDNNGNLDSSFGKEGKVVTDTTNNSSN